MARQLFEYPAVQLAGAIARREVSACAVVDAHLARIEAVNPRVNAVVRVLHDEARAAYPANLLGLPSACVPACLDAASGLPVGVLVTGRHFREDLCLDAAEHIQARCGFGTPIDPR